MTTCLSVLATCLGLLTARPAEAQAVNCQPAASWGLDRIDQRATGGNDQFCLSECCRGAGVTIYVVGTGVNITHTDFEGRAVWGYTAGPYTATTDDNGFGTMTASLAAGSAFGVARDATIVAVKVLGEFGSGSPASVDEGLSWILASHDAASPGIVLLDFSSGSCNVAINNDINRLIAAGLTVVMPAGNSNSDFCDPACPATTVPDAIIVGATDDTDGRAPFSNYGVCVDIFAPGVNVTGAWIGSPTATNTISSSGLSAGYVAGVAALHLSADPTLTPAEVQAILLMQATPITDCGSSSNMRLVYADPQVCFGIGPSCPTCGGVTQGFNEALTAGIVGPLSGDDWYWQITSPDFDDTPVVTVDGVTPGDATDDVYPDGVWNEFDAAQRWADSINAYFASQGCDTTPVTGGVWASVRNQGGTAFLSVSSECAFTLLVSDPSDPTPNCDVGAFFTPCSFNPMAEAFAGSGTDCNRNGSDDFFDTTYGLSADTNFNAIPDECEGIVYETVPTGIATTALGQAMITPNGHGMTVHNIGASGEDGFRTDTGRIDRIDFGPGAATDYVIGSSTTMTARDADGGTLVSRELVRTADGIDMITDFTSSGASSVRYEVYDDGQLVHAESAPALSFLTAKAGPQNDTTCTDTTSTDTTVVPVPFPCLPLRNYIHHEISLGGFKPMTWCEYSDRPTNNLAYLLPSGTTVCGDALSTIALVPPSSGIHSFDTNLIDMGSYVVEGVSIGMHGNDHGVPASGTLGTVLRGGSNPLDPAKPALIVSHVNATAEISPPLSWWTRPYDPAPALFVDTMPISLAGTYGGRSIILRSRGSLDGVPNTALGVASLVSSGTNSADIFAEFSSLGSPTTMVAVYNEGALVGQTVVPSGLVGTITGYEGALECTRFGKLPGPTPCFVLGVDSNGHGVFAYETVGGGGPGFVGDGPSFVGDEIRIIANEPSSPVDYIESLEISTEGIESVIVIGESSEVEPICPADFDGSGDVGFSDLATILAVWGPCPSDCPVDLDGSGDVGFGDLVDLLATWGPCSTD